MQRLHLMTAAVILGATGVSGCAVYGEPAYPVYRSRSYYAESYPGQVVVPYTQRRSYPYYDSRYYYSRPRTYVVVPDRHNHRERHDDRDDRRHMRERDRQHDRDGYRDRSPPQRDAHRDRDRPGRSVDQRRNESVHPREQFARERQQQQRRESRQDRRSEESSEPNGRSQRR
jgi:hypothetical protein